MLVRDEFLAELVPGHRACDGKGSRNDQHEKNGKNESRFAHWETSHGKDLAESYHRFTLAVNTSSVKQVRPGTEGWLKETVRKQIKGMMTQTLMAERVLYRNLDI